MPIRHCQICGIKVIVDEEKASVFPFYCDLCSSSSNTPPPMPTGSAFDENFAKPPTAPPAPPPRAATPQPRAPGLRCPVCAQDLSGSPSSAPSKATCSSCNADLVVSPDGTVKPAGDPELLRYAKSPATPTTRPPTEKLKLKIREMLQDEKQAQLTPLPTPPPPPAARPVEGPKIVLKSAPAPRPQPETKMVPKAAPPPAQRAPTASQLKVVPPPPPRKIQPAPMPEAPEETGDLSPKSSTAATRPFREDSTAATVPSIGPGAEEPEPAPPSKKTSMEVIKPRFRHVPLVVALVMALLPPAAGAGAYFGVKDDPTNRKQIEELGGHIGGAGKKVLEFIATLAPENKPEEGPAPTPKKIQQTQVKLAELKDMIVLEYETYLKNILTVYEKSDRSVLQAQRAQAEERALQTQNLINQYKNMAAGKEPDVAAEFKARLKDFLEKFYQIIMKIEHNARKATSDVAAPMIERVNRAKTDFNTFLAQYETKYGESIMVDEKTKLVKMEASAAPNPDADLPQRLETAYRDYAEAEKDYKKKGSQAGEFDRLSLESKKQNYESLKAEYERKTGKSFEPPK